MTASDAATQQGGIVCCRVCRIYANRIEEVLSVAVDVPFAVSDSRVNDYIIDHQCEWEIVDAWYHAHDYRDVDADDVAGVRVINIYVIEVA